ncbi:LpqB family beta-propeller domain-containing protein [Streptacidiphilus neutrinimicus]|uniref:LpqB family beta-propeller domain-containing protein n=1 Tax=Streptacidiphilus neutrinimicus TaxID=105420 RepID=UPI000B08FCA6|nr:LpqB family beta-propeller domain-containing protein [Streptacidiphilus neutrinimicus]
MKRSEQSRFRTVRAVALSGAVLGLAGCATMPGNGPVTLGPTASGNTQNTRVELIPVPPADQERPDQLLYGFLDALGSDQSDYRTARLYLSDPNWQPSGAVDVLDTVPQLKEQRSSDPKSVTITASGTEDASLDTHGSYTAAAPGTAVSVDYHFKMDDKGQWRIVDPPATVLTSQRDFQRIYQSVNLYFPAAAGHTSGGVSPLVADPVYIRGRVDNPLQLAAQQLLDGPSTWLQPVVTTGFPTNAQNSKVELDTSGSQAKAYLSLGADADWSPGACQTMAVQLYTTLTVDALNIQATPPTSVALYRDKNGSPICTTPSEGAYNPVRVGATAYFLGADHRLNSVTPQAGSASASVEDVPGKLVPAGITIGSFAVSPGADGQVASISDDGRALYVSTLHATTAPTTAALRSGTPEALSSPSWDGTGTLWAVDTEPGGTTLRAVAGGVSVPVDVQGLPDGATIQQVRVAPDGARIALLVKTGDNTTVEIGRVRHLAADDATHQTPSLSVEELRQTAAGITSISSLSWQDGDGLVVVGQQSGTTSVIPVEMDGSPSSLGTIQTLSGVTDVTTLPGDLQWLLATAKNPDQQNEIFYSQLSAFRWLPITESSSSRGSGVRFPG